MKRYYLVNTKNAVIAKVNARDTNHAAEKFEAFGHIVFNNVSRVVSAADYRADEKLVSEQIAGY